MRVRWLKKALENLEAEANFLAEENPAAAGDFVEAIFAATGRLAEFPAMGRPGRVFGTRELVISGSAYLIPYRVRNNAVEILRLSRGA